MEQAETSQEDAFDEDHAATPNGSSPVDNSTAITSTNTTTVTDSGGRPKSTTASATNQTGDDRALERLAWRCVEAARAASRLVPPLSAHALLPAAALRIPHSCTPAVRVPAGDRRSYIAGGTTAGGGSSGGGAVAEAEAGKQKSEPGVPTAGAAGWPLTVAMVALRDIPAGAPLSCAWVAAEEAFSARMAGLKEYSRVVVAPPPAVSLPVPPPSSSSPPPPRPPPPPRSPPSTDRPSEGSSLKEEEFAGLTGSGGRSGPSLSGCRGCGCPKCVVEGDEEGVGGGGGGEGNGGDNGGDNGGNHSRSSGAVVERLLEAARQAVDEDRYGIGCRWRVWTCMMAE